MENIATNNLRSCFVSLVILEMLILAVRSSGFMTETILGLEQRVSTMKESESNRLIVALVLFIQMNGLNKVSGVTSQHATCK